MADRIAKGAGKLFGDPNSVVDYLKGQGQDSSPQARAQMAASYGIQNYSGSATQNMQLLQSLKAGTPPAPKGASPASSAPVVPGTADPANIDTTAVIDAKLAISQKNATYGKDPALDNVLASQYVDPADNIKASYIDKIGMETGLYADIQNIDTKVLETYKILAMPSNDIFSNPNMSAAEKIAATNARRDIALNRINNLRRIQQGKQQEMKELAAVEQAKAEAQAKAQKEALEYLKYQMDVRKMELDEKRFGLDVYKAEQSTGMDQAKLGIDMQKLQLDRDKFIADTSAGATLPEGNFSGLGVGQSFGNWNVTQTYGTNSVLKSDNVPLANGQVGTPGIDLKGNAGDPIASFAGGTVVKVVSGKSNIPQSEWAKTGGSYGNQVVVKDQSGKLHYYNHLQDVGNLKEGQAIQRGQVIGTMGNSGTSTGTHLDYRVESEKGWEDPRQFMNTAPGKDEITNLDAFLQKRTTTPGGDVAGKVKPLYVNQILSEDIGRFELTNEEFKKLKAQPGVDTKVSTLYSLEKFKKDTTAYTGDQFVTYLQKALSQKDDPATRKAILQMAVYSGKLDDDVFQPGIFNDAAGYDMLQEYFDDPKTLISEMKKNMIASGYEIPEKKIVNPMEGPYNNVYQNYYRNMYQ